MKGKHSFLTEVCHLSVPVALQSMLQASFSIVDQVMIGQLGSVQVAGVGLAGKFASVFSVLVSSVGAAAGIMISQYLGQKNRKAVQRSFYLNLLAAAGIAVLFTVLCVLLPEEIMGLYIRDGETRRASADYLSVIAGMYLPMAGAVLLSALFRCMEKAELPLYAGIGSAVVNTGLNYILIFGKCGCPSMGARGAAIATVIAQWVNFLMMLFMAARQDSMRPGRSEDPVSDDAFCWEQYGRILIPILVCEFVWSLGENVYAAIYGHMGTRSSAAMTLIQPVQGLMIGALCGLSQAAGVMIGKRLGRKEYEEAYEASKKLMLYGAVGAVLLSVLVILTSFAYVRIYQVEASVRLLTRQILVAYALIAPFKVLNMILGGGIIRSGGKTAYVMVIDMIGTWGFGVPLGLVSAFIWKLSIPYVYFMLSLEECVRFGISLAVFCRKGWMHSLQAEKS